MTYNQKKKKQEMIGVGSSPRISYLTRRDYEP